MRELGPAVRLIPRLVRSPWARFPALGLIATVAVILISYVMATSWGLSHGQVVDRDFSGHSAKVVVDEDIDPGHDDILNAVEEAAPGQVWVLSSAGVQIAGSAGTRLLYQESRWGQAQFGYELVSGEWPQKAGEAVVTRDLRPSSDMLSLESDVTNVRVVGVVDDVYSESPVLLAAPGTWESMPSSLARAHDRLTAQVSVLTSDERVAQVESALAEQGISTTAIHASDQQPEQNWIAASPYSFTVPALVIPLLVTVTTIFGGRRSHQRLVRQVVQVGGPRIAGTVMVAAALLIVVIGGVIVGGLTGWGLSHAARAVSSRWNGQVQAPYPSLMTPLAITAGSASVGWALCVVNLNSSYGTVRPRRLSTLTFPSRLRRWTALLAGCAGVLIAPRATTMAPTMALGTILLIVGALLTPDVLVHLSHRLDRLPLHRKMGARLLAADTRAVAETVLTMTIVALPLTVMILLTTTTATARSNSLAAVGPGQIAVHGGGGVFQPAPTAALEAAEAALQPSETADRAGLQLAPLAWYEAGVGRSSSVIAVDTVRQIESVWGVSLTNAQEALLNRGGALVVHPDAALTIDGRSPSPKIPTMVFAPTEEWANNTGAVMLTEELRARGVEVTSGGTVYSGVSNDQADAVLAALRERGLNQRAIDRYHPPTQILAPAAVVASAIVLAMLMLAVTVACAHSRTTSLRRQFGRFVAIGANGRFVRRAFLVSQVSITGISLVWAVLVTGLTVTVFVLRHGTAMVNPPWVLMSALVAALVTAQAAAGLIATRKLRPELDRNL